MGTRKTEIKTLFFDASPQAIAIYNAVEDVRITLDLESAGPLRIGTSSVLQAPNGRLMPTDRTVTFLLSAGTILYGYAVSPQRLAYSIEPVPYLMEILTAIKGVAGSISHSVQGVLALFGKAPPRSRAQKDC